jgi:hypothetical protein
MSVVKTHRAADVSPGASRVLLARHGIDVAPTLEIDDNCCTADARYTKDEHDSAQQTGAAKTKAVLDLLDSVEQRLGKLDNKAPSANREIFGRLKDIDGRATSLEAGQPATQGGVNHDSPQPNSGAAVSPTSLPEKSGGSEFPENQHLRDPQKPHTAAETYAANINGGAPSLNRQAQDEETIDIGDLYHAKDGFGEIVGGIAGQAVAGPLGAAAGSTLGSKIDNATNGQTVDALSPLERAKQVLAKGQLVAPDPRIVAAEAARISARQAEVDYNRKAFGLVKR